MALNPYEALRSYKQRKISRIGEGFKLPNIRENIGRIQTTQEGVLRRSGLPVSARINLQRENEMAAGVAFAETAAPLYLSKERERDILRDQIAELGIKSELFEEAEKEKRDAAKKAKDKLWTKLGFTAAGLALAPFTGGASIPIAAGVGDIAAGAGVGTGDFLGEETIDEGLIAQGLMNVVGSVTSEINLAKPRAVTSLLGENVEGIMGMDDIELSRFSDTIKLLSSSGDYDAVLEYINSMFAESGGTNLGQYQNIDPLLN